MGGEAEGVVDGGLQAGRVGLALPGDVERRAVVGTGAHEGQAQRDVDALVQAQVLDRNQALVVVLRHHHVEAALARLHEDRIAGPGAAGVDALAPRGLDGRQDDAGFLVAEQPAFAGVRIQARHRHARRGHAQRAPALVRQPDGRHLRVEIGALDGLAQRTVDGHEHGGDDVVGQHHGHAPAPPRSARISVCPGYGTPAADSASLWMGAVTMPATRPSRARSMAWQMA